MNVWNKVFLGVIIVTAIGVVVLASVDRKVRSTGQQHTASLQERIEKADTDIARIIAGTAPMKSRMDKSSPSELSFEELRNALRERYHERGRAWFDCHIFDISERTLGQSPGLQQVIARVILTGPLVPNETGAEIEVVFPEHLRGLVYVFEEAGNEEGNMVGVGRFIGRFNVDSEPTRTPFPDDEGNQKNGYRVTLVSADPVNDVEIEQIFDTTVRSRWTILMSPPVDRIAGFFDSLTEEEKQMIPQELRDRFQSRVMPELTEEEREGVDRAVLENWERIRATMDDPESDAAEDFALMLDWLYMRRSTTLREIENTLSNIATFKTAEEKTQAENEKLRADGDLEEKSAAAMDVQRDAVKAQLEQYQEEVNNLMVQIEKLQTLNEAYVAKIAEYHMIAVEKMETQAANAGQEGKQEQ